MLFDIFDKCNYTAEVKIYSGKITSLSIRCNDTIAIITMSGTKQDDTAVWIQDEDYEVYCSVVNAFYNGPICKEHMSYHNEITENRISITGWSKNRLFLMSTS